MSEQDRRRLITNDRLRAERILARVKANDVVALAHELAAFRVEILVCAVMRFEREFIVKPRPPKKPRTPFSHKPVPTGNKDQKS